MTIPMIVDIILVLIFAACIYTGAKNGFVRAVASLLASVVALCASLFVVMQFSPVVADKVVNPWLESVLTREMEENMSESMLETVDSLINTTKKIFVSLQEMMGGEEEPEKETSVGAATGDVITSDDPETTEDVVRSVADAIGNVMTAILMFVILFALFLAILRVLIDQLRFINKIPIVGPMNALLGAALGAISGAVFLIVPVWVVTNFVPGLFDVSAVIDPALLKQSKVLTFILTIIPH